MGLMPTKTDVAGAQGDEAKQPATPRDPERYVPEGESNASPEEQAQYEEFVTNALGMIYAEGEVRPQIMESLQIPEGPTGDGNAPDPAVFTLANSAVQIIMRLDDSAREAGQEVTNDVLLHGGMAVMEELAEIAREARIHDYTDEELQGAVAVAMDMYREKAINDGRTTKEQLETEFGEAVEADQAGDLGTVVPGIDEQPKE